MELGSELPFYVKKPKFGPGLPFHAMKLEFGSGLPFYAKDFKLGPGFPFNAEELKFMAGLPFHAMYVCLCSMGGGNGQPWGACLKKKIKKNKMMMKMMSEPLY